ncbi:MAG: aldo/keto reductase [Haloarculaceae archaeon]
MKWVRAGGVRLPAIGLGTYGLAGEAGTETVERALELGYRHVDTAEHYGNEAAIGAALAAADVPREAVFVSTKVWRTNLGRADLLSAARASAERLGVECIDLLSIHAPNRSIPIDETVGAMNELQAAGLVAHVGVSNCSVSQLRAARRASETPIVANQVQYNPLTDRDALLTECVDADVILTAASPLAKGRLADDPVLAAVGDRYGKTPAQVALRWLVQQPQVVAIPKASSPAHLRENLDVFDFALSDAEMKRIAERRPGDVDPTGHAVGQR